MISFLTRPGIDLKGCFYFPLLPWTFKDEMNFFMEDILNIFYLLLCFYYY